MQLSAEGLQLLRDLEGIRREPYRDSAGLLTIGCGHLLTTDERDSGTLRCGDTVIRWTDGPLSDDQIDELLAADVAWAEDAVEAGVQVPLSQGQFDALVCFAFNVGASALRSSTLCRLLNAGDYDTVPAQLARWTRAGGQVVPGLVTRRAREAALWQRG